MRGGYLKVLTLGPWDRVRAFRSAILEGNWQPPEEDRKCLETLSQKVIELSTPPTSFPLKILLHQKEKSQALRKTNQPTNPLKPKPTQRQIITQI